MNNTLAPAAFLEKLRNATSQSHTNLESLPVSVSIIKPDVTTNEYGRYLSLMHDVVADVEENIFPVLRDIIPDLKDRVKKHFLEQDLVALGVVKEDIQRPITKLNKTASLGFALGIMYVVEGSSLGGRVIYKNINTALGYDEENGARYFAGYGGQTGSHWKKFLDVLVQYETNHNCGEAIIAGADYAFKAISAHFSKSQSV